SFASRIEIRATGQEDVLLLSVTDDGTGGADPARGSGLSGLAQRVAVVDGGLTIASPAGGPTQITVEPPLRAWTSLRGAAPPGLRSERRRKVGPPRRAKGEPENTASGGMAPASRRSACES